MHIPHLPHVEIQSIRAISDARTALIVSSPPAWQAVHADLGGLLNQHIIWSTTATIATWDEQIRTMVASTTSPPKPPICSTSTCR